MSISPKPAEWTPRESQRSSLKADAAPKSINLEVGTLRAVLRRHRKWADMQPDVKMMTVHETTGKALTENEESRLLDCCGRSRSRTLLPIVTLALHTGMRRGEIQTLRWQQVDLLNRTVTVGTTKTAPRSWTPTWQSETSPRLGSRRRQRRAMGWSASTTAKMAKRYGHRVGHSAAVIGTVAFVSC